MLPRTLTYIPWDPVKLAYGAPATATFPQWGIDDAFSFAFKSQVPDELNLATAGGALAPIPFVNRSLLKIVLDGVPFFTGYVQDDLDREGMPNKNEGHIKLAGPWWFLENLPYELDIQILVGITPAGLPIWKDTYWTHFTLNLPLVAQFQGGNGFVTNSVTYAVQQLGSRAQISAVLDYAIAHGAYLQYKPTDIVDIPVLPADVLNITCAESIRRQLESLDAVVWFDHTQDPPAFHCQPRSALGSRTVKAGAPAPGSPVATGFRLKERFDLRVPYVIINYEEPVNVGGVSGTNLTQDIYPLPIPGDSLKALITTVPITAVSGSMQSKFIQTDTLDINDLAFWQRRFPEMDPAKNPNAENDFADLQFTSGVAPSRQGTLPNMLIGGGYAVWMGGHFQQDVITAQFDFTRQRNANLPGTQFSAQTKRKTIWTTDLNFPAGVNLNVNNWTSLGENLDDYLGLAQIVYENLSARQWEGTIPIFEDIYTGDQVMGVNLNVAGGVTDWLAANALVQSITGTVRTGGIHYEIQVGPNKSLTAQNIAARMKAARYNYVTCFFFHPSPQTLNQIQESQQDACEDGGSGEGMQTQLHVVAPDSSGGVLVTGDPSITLQGYDAYGNPLTPASTSPMGVIFMDLAATQGTDTDWHTLTLQEVPLTLADGTIWTGITLVSEPYYQLPGISMSEVSGTGAPAAATLPANDSLGHAINYHVGQYYIDKTTPTAPILWRCMTAGTNASSVWAKVSGGGGGGSVSQYTFVADCGDFVVATPPNGTVSTALTTGFASGAGLSSITVANATGISAGQLVSGTGLPAYTVVTAVNAATEVVSISSTGLSTAASSGNYTFGNVAIAKPPKLRCSISAETLVDGTGLHTYTYAPLTVANLVVAYVRTNNWTSGSTNNSETEQITPPYLVGDPIFAIGMPTQNQPIIPGSSTTTPVSLLDIHDKDWAE
jgi:hypothetical protein